MDAGCPRSHLPSWMEVRLCDGLLIACKATAIKPLKDASYDAYVKFVENSIAYTQLEHDFRMGPQSSAKKVHCELIGEDASAVTPGANLNDDAPLNNTLKWTPQQEALRKNKTKKVIISKDYGVGECTDFKSICLILKYISKGFIG